MVGIIKKKYDKSPDRKFGFIHANDGSDYHFSIADLDGLAFDAIAEEMRVLFDIKRTVGPDNTGAASRVRLHPADVP
jgi:cold shock CspA family protein